MPDSFASCRTTHEFLFGALAELVDNSRYTDDFRQISTWAADTGLICFMSHGWFLSSEMLMPRELTSTQVNFKVTHPGSR